MNSCSVDGCGKPNYAKGFCKKHYQRMRSTGTTDDPYQEMTCSASGCESTAKSKGLCTKHYTRLIRYGDIQTTKIIVGDDISRFMSSMVVSSTGCWEWSKFRKNGYGIAGLNGKLEQAHRAAWMVFKGDIPEGMQVNHKCNNRPCINPDHLYICDQVQNMKDMSDAGRGKWHKGSDNSQSKLNDESVREIKLLIDSGATNRSIAGFFDVSQSCISSIKNGRTWAHVEK